MVFERDAFVRSASRGLTVYATGVSVTDSVFVDNGMVGIHANAADRLDIERDVIARNNNEHFVAASSPVASSAGIKVTYTGSIMIKDNVVEDNAASGIWCDLSCHGLEIVDNLARRNDQSGIYVEVSGQALVASNISVQNGEDGLRLGGTTDTRAYNNTLADNAGHAVIVYDDGRRNTNSATLALGITWRPARNTIANNLLTTSASGSLNPLLFTQDYDRPVVDDAASMITALDGDIYARPDSLSPATLATWVHGAPAAAGAFATLGALRSTTGTEPSGIELTGPDAPPLYADAGAGDYTVAPGSPAAGGGVALPDDVAAAIGVPAAGPVDRGALLAPSPAASATTTAVTADAVETPSPAAIQVVVGNANPLALAPSGTVTLLDATSGTTIGTAPLDGTGVAWFGAPVLPWGAHVLRASYGGDVDDRPSSGSTTLDVHAALSHTTITAGAAGAVFGQTVTFAAHVTSTVAPTGAVTFHEGDQTLGAAPVDANGDAVLTVTALAVGPHTVGASYAGDDHTAPSDDTDDAGVVVDPAGTRPSLAATPAVPELGEPVALHAVVGVVAPGAGVPAGTVSFYDGTTRLAGASLDGGAADADAGVLAPGTHLLTVRYGGAGNFAAATSGVLTLTVVQRRTATAVVVSAPAAVFGQTVTVAAHVGDDLGAVTDGSVTFTDNAAVLGVAVLDTGGDAVLDVSALALGDHTVTATFGGNTGGDGASSASAPVSVAPATVAVDAAVTPVSATAGGRVHVHASVMVVAPGRGTPSGTVHVDDAATGARVADLSLDAAGTVDGDLEAGTPGAHTLTVTYAGGDGFAGGRASVGYVVVAATTTTAVTVDVAHPQYGRTVTVRATVAGGAVAPTGTVQFSDNGNPLGPAPLDGTGTATLSTSALDVGAHSIVAVYSGDGNHTASDSSAAPVTVDVNPAETQTTLAVDVPSPAHGQLVTFSVSVSGTSALGTVTLLDGAVPVSAALPVDGNGHATVSLASLAVGTHTITAAYGGDANHEASDTSAVPAMVVVAKAVTATSLVASAPSAKVGVPVTLTASVSVRAPGVGVPLGTVTFADGGVALAAPVPVDGSGQARLVVTTLPLGVRGLTASYAGDGDTTTSAAAPVSVTITRRAPSITVTSSVAASVSGQPVTFAVSVSDGAGPVPDGSAVFSDTSVTPVAVLATVAVGGNGKAAYTVATLGVGAHVITARYLGGVNDNAAGPASAAQTVARAASTTLLAAPATGSPGASLTLTATVSVPAPGRGAPTGTVTFFDGGTTLGPAVALGAGSQAVLTRSLASGAHHLAAVYSGDAAIAPSTSAVVASTIAPRATKVTPASSTPASVYGQTVTFDARVTDATGPVVAGSVVFRDTIAGTTVTLGTVALDASGHARLAVAFKKVGAHSVLARYLGSASDAVSPPATVVQNVARAAMRLTVKITPLTVAAGVKVTLSVTATAVAPGHGTPSGAFTVSDGATQVASGTLVATTGAQKVVFKPRAGAGAHRIIVATAGTALFAPARSSATIVTVKRAS